MVNEKIRSQILGGCLKDYRNHMAGIYRGYRIIIEQDKGQYLIKINARSSVDINNEILNEFLRKQQEQNPLIRNLQIYSFSVVLEVSLSAANKNIADSFNAIIEPVIDFLVRGRYTSACEVCGTDTFAINCYEINGEHHHICERCAAEVNATLQKNQNPPAKRPARQPQSNFIAGIGGAAAGALIGCILWIIIYKLGFVGGIAGIAVAFCSFKGYELLGGSLDKKGIICSIAIMVILIFITNKLAWSWGFSSALKSFGYKFGEIFGNLGAYLSEAKLTLTYWAELLVGYALVAVYVYPEIARAFSLDGINFKIKR